MAESREVSVSCCSSADAATRKKNRTLDETVADLIVRYIYSTQFYLYVTISRKSCAHNLSSIIPKELYKTFGFYPI